MNRSLNRKLKYCLLVGFLVFSNSLSWAQDTVVVYQDDEPYIQHQFLDSIGIENGCFCELRDSLPTGFYIFKIKYKESNKKEYYQFEGSYQDGLKSGVHSLYYIKERLFKTRKLLVSSEPYVNGVLHGPASVWSTIDHYKITRLMFFQEGELDGPFVFFGSNGIKRIVHYQKGEIVSVVDF